MMKLSLLIVATWAFSLAMPVSATDLEFVLGQQPPKLIPPGPGAGEWGSEKPSLKNRIAAAAAKNYLSSQDAKERWGADAAGTFHHYFKNTGADYHIELARVVAEVPSVRAYYNKQLENFYAFAEALEPGQYRFVTNNVVYNRIPREESENWYLAMDGHQLWAEGTLEVSYDEEREQKLYKAEFTYHLWDPYDWDPGVKIPIDTPFGKVIIDQEKVGEFHRQGLAKEFITLGLWEVSLNWESGELGKL